MNKRDFYTLSFTWGLPLTIIGLIVAFILICTGKKPKKWGWCYYFEIGKSWGGLEIGIIFLTDTTPTNRTRNHEHGHAIQNCKYGLIMPFLSLSSAARYWYRELRYHRKGLTPPTAYDDYWFEGDATRLGTELIDRIGEDGNGKL